jgi:DinB superfamily
MKDALFIQQMLQRGKEAGEKVRTEFTNLSLQQLNWKPAPESWSIGQCLDHLIVSDCLYFPDLKKIAEKKFEMTLWERWNPLNDLFGKMLVHQLQEDVKRKVNTPKIFIPSASLIDAGILERFQKHLNMLSEYISATGEVDIDKTYITSPVSKFVTYNLRNAITILIQHIHRHINQALRVKSKEDFPK